MSQHPEVARRTGELIAGARAVLSAIESAVAAPYSADGLYQVFAGGFLPVPYLWECRDEFRKAVQWRTRLVRGSVRVVDEAGREISPQERAQLVADGIRGRFADLAGSRE
jgi:hypothetical protein